VAEEVVSQKTVMQRLVEENSSDPFVMGSALTSEPLLAELRKRDGGYLKRQTRSPNSRTYGAIGIDMVIS
jgi:hypothetical protein